MLALRVFVPFALGYFLSYLFRVVNAVIAPDLIRDVGLDASSLGLLTSAYFLTFAAFQLPLGVLLDRIGPRRTEAALLLFAALGAIVFGWAGDNERPHPRPRPDRPWCLCMPDGRVQSVRHLVSAVTACLFVNGCQMAAGGLGAITGTMPRGDA